MKKKIIVKFSSYVILMAVFLNLIFVDFGFASETRNIDLSSGTLNGVDRTKYPGELRLTSDKSFLANYNDTTNGTKGETAESSTAPAYGPVKNDNGFRSREAVNESIGFAQNYSTGADPVVMTISTDDGNESGGGYSGSFNQELADMLHDENNDCYGTCIAGSGWEAMGYNYTEFINSTGVDAGNRSTADNLQRIVAMGNEVGSHSVTHADWSAGADRNLLTNIWLNIYRKSETGVTSISYSYNPSTQILTIDETGTAPTDYNIDLSGATTMGAAYTAINNAITTNYTVTKIASSYDAYSKSDLDLAGISCNSFYPTQSCDISIDHDSSLYLTDTAVENILRDSKKSLEGKIGGGYEVKSFAYPGHIHDRHIMDLVSKYYQGARDSGGATYAHQPNASEAPEYSLSLYETGLTGGGGWFVKADANGIVDVNATKALFKDKILCTNTSGLNATTTRYGKVYSPGCFSKDVPWVNIYSHFWMGFDIEGTDHERGKQYIEATLQAIKELAEAYPSNPPVVMKTFGQGTEYFRNKLPINYLQYGYTPTRAGRETYQMLGRNNGIPPWYNNTLGRFATSVTQTTSPELTVGTINNDLNLPTDNPIWKITKEVPSPNPGYIHSNDYHILSGQTYTFSLWACAPGSGTFTLTARGGSGPAWSDLTRGDCNNPANWHPRTTTVSVTAGTYESNQLGVTIGTALPQDAFVYVTGVQFYNNGVAPDSGEWLNYATKNYVGLNYPSQNNIDYSAGTTSLWWKPMVDNTWPADRPIFSAKGIRAFYNRKSSKLIFETYNSSDGAWKTLEYSWTPFSANTNYHLAFTWDEEAGKAIYIGGASVASDSTTWTALAEGASDKLYVGTDYYGYADSQAYIDDFAVFPNVLSAGEVDAIHNSALALTDTYSAGSFISDVYNVDYFQNDPYLNWNGTLNGGVIKFQTRSASSEVGVGDASWTGPDGLASYYDTSGEAVSMDNSNRYVQIKAYLEPDPDDASQTPELTSLSLGYERDITSPTLSLTSPQNNSTTTDSSVVVAGTASDADSGLASVSVNDLDMADLNSFNRTVNLALGSNPITIIATDKAGNTATSTLSITRVAVAATATETEQGETSSTQTPARSFTTNVATTAPAILPTSFSVVDSTQNNLDIPILSDGANPIIYTQYPTFKGQTTPNSLVFLEINPGGIKFSTTSDSNGYWEYTVKEALAFGSYSISVIVKEPSTQKILDSKIYSFQIADKTKVADSGQVSTPASETAKTSKSNYWIYIIGAAMLILIVGIVVARRRSKRISV